MSFIDYFPIVISLLFLIIFTYYLIFKKDKSEGGILTSNELELIDFKKKSNILFTDLITSKRLEEDKFFFTDIIYKLRSSLDRSSQDPYEIESITDIIIENMFQKGDHVSDYLFPLFNNLCEFENKTYSHFIGSIFQKVAANSKTSHPKMAQAIINRGSEKLKKTIFLHFIKSNLNYSSLNELVLELIKDQDAIEDYSDILAINYFQDSKVIISIINSITPKYNLLNIGNLNDKKEQAVLKLSVFFFIKILIDSKAKIENIEEIKNLLFNKYKIILNSIFSYKENVVSKRIKLKVYEFIEDAGIQQWRRGIGNIETGRAINNYFFVQNPVSNYNFSQREQLENFFKYFIKLSNQNFEDFDEVAFKEDAFKMIDYGKFSINGYLGVVAIHLYLIKTETDTLKLIDETVNRLIKNPTESNHFFLCIFCDNLLKTKNQNISFYNHVLSKVKKHANQLIVDGIIDFSPFFYLDNDYFKSNMEEPIFNELVAQFFNISSTKTLNKILPKLNYIAFLESKQASRFIVEKIFNLNKLNDDTWNKTLITFLAICYETDKEFMSSLIKRSSNSIDINEWQLINNVNQDILSLHLPRSYQSKWNEFIVNGLIYNKRIKYFLIRDLIGGLTQSNSVEDFSKEFRKFIVELTKSYFNDEVIYFDDLKQDEVFSFTVSEKDLNKAEFYNYD